MRTARCRRTAWSPSSRTRAAIAAGGASARRASSATRACGASTRTRSARSSRPSRRPRPRSTRRSRSSTPRRPRDWAPIRHRDTLHDRASYRYFWQVLERAHRTGQPLPAEAAGLVRQRLFFVGDIHERMARRRLQHPGTARGAVACAPGRAVAQMRDRKRRRAACASAALHADGAASAPVSRTLDASSAAADRARCAMRTPVPTRHASARVLRSTSRCRSRRSRTVVAKAAQADAQHRGSADAAASQAARAVPGDSPPNRRLSECLEVLRTSLKAVE